MPRNGSGTYSLPASSWNPAVTGTTIESSAANATLTDLASALTQSLSKDGQTVPTGNLPMGGFKLTGLADGAASTDSMAYGQGAKLVGNNTFTGDQTINGSVSLSGSLTVTGPVIFSSGTISVGDLTVTSVASIASLNVTGAANTNILNVASVLSAKAANIGVLSVGSSVVIGAASGGSKGTGTLNAQAIYINGTEVQTSAVVYNYIAGCVLTYATTTTISIGAGQVADSTNTSMITVSAGTLNLATTGANGLRTGSLANNTNYAVFVIYGSSGQAFMADTALTPGGALPSGYTLYRRIAVFRTNGSAQVIQFIQNGRRFWWSNPADLTAVIATTNLPTSKTNYTAPILTGKKWPVIFRIYYDGVDSAGRGATLFDPDSGVTASTTTVNASPLPDFYSSGAASAQFQTSRDLIITNTSSEISAVGAGANQTLAAAMLAWEDDGV